LNHPLAWETWKLQYKDCKARAANDAVKSGVGLASMAATAPKVNLTPEQLRQEAIDEIIRTEREYVTDLETTISVSFFLKKILFL
jgi:hypothetical protein